MSGLLETDKATIIAWAKKHPQIARVHLFGSRARGKHSERSDIDLAIEIIAQTGDSNSEATWISFIQDYKKAPDLALSVDADLQWYDREAKLKIVGAAVEKDGLLLYER